MRSMTYVNNASERLAARQLGELRAKRTFLQLIAAVSIVRTALTRVLPLAGCGAWWTTLGCMLPGLGVVLLLGAAMRLTRSQTLQELARCCLGRVGGWIVSGLLAALLLLDGAASFTALITLFTEGVGTRGTQLTLALLTGGALLCCLHREGLPRAAYLLRYVLLGAALIAAASGLTAIRVDGLFPMQGSGATSIAVALRSGAGMSWPLVLLLTIPPEDGRPRIADACPVLLMPVLVLLALCLTVPHEVLMRHAGLADCLLLPARYAATAVRVLAQCLMMLSLFLTVAGSAQLATDFLLAPLGHTPAWLPYAVLILLTGTQALDTPRLWDMLGRASPWLLIPPALLAACCLPIALIRRKRT